MMNFLRLTFYFFTLLVKLSRPGGTKAVAAKNISLRQQLIASTRGRKRAPKLTLFDRILFGFITSLINPKKAL